jgi:hypothetical protein
MQDLTELKARIDAVAARAPEVIAAAEAQGSATGGQAALAQFSDASDALAGSVTALEAAFPAPTPAVAEPVQTATVAAQPLS